MICRVEILNYEDDTEEDGIIRYNQGYSYDRLDIYVIQIIYVKMTYELYENNIDGVIEILNMSLHETHIVAILPKKSIHNNITHCLMR